MTTNAVLLTERTELIGEADQENPRVVKNVALIGLKSKNGYGYSESALRNAVRLYEGRHVYLDHVEKGQRRSTRDLAGHIKNARFEDGRIRGDIHVLETDAGRTFRGLFDGDLAGVGMSHMANGKVDKATNVVESIDSVYSVDAVLNPATTTSFREETEEPMDLKILKEQHAPLVEEIAKEARDKALAEAKGAFDLDLKVQLAKARTEAFAEGQKSEATRQTDIRALYEEAGMPERAETMLQESTNTVEMCRKDLLEALIKKNKPPKGGDGDAPLDKDENAVFRKEFKEHNIGEEQGLTEDEWIDSRRKDEGLPARQKKAS